MASQYPQLPRRIKDRVAQTLYMHMGEIRLWDGKILKCEHGRQRARCEPCGGVWICKHRKQRHRCEPCGGSGICNHGRERYRCEPCGGSGICVHRIIRQYCGPCGGSGLCSHRRNRYYCGPCGGGGICGCGLHQINHRFRKFRQCAHCYYHANPDHELRTWIKTRENEFVNALRESHGEFITLTDTTLGACSRRRPDVFMDRGSHSIVVECDEKQHEGYSCENRRITELFEDAAWRPMIVIRFNPDKYIDKDGNTVQSCFEYGMNGWVLIDPLQWEDRISALRDTVDQYMLDPPDKMITTIHLFYDGH